MKTCLHHRMSLFLTKHTEIQFKSVQTAGRINSFWNKKTLNCSKLLPTSDSDLSSQCVTSFLVNISFIYHLHILYVHPPMPTLTEVWSQYIKLLSVNIWQIHFHFQNFM